ncbi:MAG: PAS domain-containing protein, partial [Leptolyngbyaceae cyanobacterium SM2_3_12]|nr:PAS domain-containing protein [Leptolyngbyaceae cyanobacterium SM2_3_12]
PEVLDAAFEELTLTLEELRTAEEDLQRQNQQLLQVHLALTQEQRRYQDLFNLAPDGYVVIDRQGVIQAANQAIVTLLRVYPDPLVGKPMVIFIAPEARSTFQQKLQQLTQRSDSHADSPQGWAVQLCPRHSPPWMW